MIVSKATNSHTNIAATLNGAIAGLWQLQLEPLTPSMGQAVIIGAVGGVDLYVWNEAIRCTKN